MTRLLKSRSPSVSINYHPFKVPNLLTLGNRYLQVVADLMEDGSKPIEEKNTRRSANSNNIC